MMYFRPVVVVISIISIVLILLWIFRYSARESFEAFEELEHATNNPELDETTNDTDRGTNDNDDPPESEAFVESRKKEIISDNDTIFVSLASYRDPLCPATLHSIFSNASRPDLIHVGLCQQNDALKDQDCVNNDKIKPEWHTQIRTLRVAHHDAMGPTWARYMCSTLLNNEKYYFQIDSHVLLAKDWDATLVQMIKDLKDKGVQKPIISHYARVYEDFETERGESNEKERNVTTICKSYFDDNKMISFEGADYVKIAPGDQPRPSPYTNAGMIFGESQFAREVPFDPNLPFLFIGEEILYSARLWTHGWDIFTPNRNVIFHYYTRSNEPKFWKDIQHANDYDAVNKVRNLLELEEAKAMSPHMAKNLHVYGLGSERTLKEYLEFAGIDKERKIVTYDFCKSSDVRERWEKYRVREPKAKPADPPVNANPAPPSVALKL